jgi:hypothetical protein
MILQRGISNEYQYMQKMFVSVVYDGFWGDFTAIKWISDYLQKLMYVWSNITGRIIDKQECEFELKPLHLVFGNNHFKTDSYLY